MLRRLLIALSLFASPLLAEQKWNFIVFLIDDLGATDIGCYGSKYYETPNIDQLAKDGARFTVGYSACTVCSPTRAAILTGKYPARLHITDWIPGHARKDAKLKIPAWQQELPASERTVAEALKEKGYATCAVGKWHLSPDGPGGHGFDTAVADNHRGQPATYLSPYKNPNLTDGPAGEELTARCTEEALKFVESNKEKPFFVYLPHFAVHTPLGGKPGDISYFAERATKVPPQGKPAYAALIKAVDDSVGRVRAKLKEMNLSERTVIIFTGDNGGLEMGKVTDNLNVRAGKGSAYEGGVRVPLIVYWPGVTKAGAEIQTPAISNDLPVTVADIAGAKLPGDGKSLVPLLKPALAETPEAEALAARPLFWHYPHYHPGGATPYSAIRLGSWRLVRFYEDNHQELYNLADDPEEKSDLSTTKPEKLAELAGKLDAWLKDTGAQLPTPAKQ